MHLIHWILSLLGTGCLLILEKSVTFGCKSSTKSLLTFACGSLMPATSLLESFKLRNENMKKICMQNPTRTTQKKNLNENVGSPLGHLCFKFERVFNIIQDYVMRYFYFTLRILKLFYFLVFKYGRKQLAVSKCAKYLCNSFFGSLF